MSAQHTQGRLYIRTNRHPNTDGTAWGWVDLYEPGSMRQASPPGMHITWSRGQQSEANARRLVACWNACEGISTEALERLVNTIDRAYVSLQAQRDKLLAALEVMLRNYTAVHDIGDVEMQPAIYQARAAIAEVKGN